MVGLICEIGLDLVLHTPGGDPTAAEGIVNYLHAKFGRDVRVIVPQMAMFAGTMLACSARSILMGKQSCLGPIDPQYGGVPAYNIKQNMRTPSLILMQIRMLKHIGNCSYRVTQGRFTIPYVTVSNFQEILLENG